MIKSQDLEIVKQNFVCQLILLGTVYQSFPLKQWNIGECCKTLVLIVLEIKLLAANGTPLLSSKITCSIYFTSCWELKLKGVTIVLDKLHFKTHKKFDGSIGLTEFFLTAMLRLIAFNMGDK